MQNIVLSAKNLIKKFDSFTALNNISFDLYEGEILGLLGPNGAGKTTTIQILLGILKQTSGDVYYFGKNLKNYREEILEFVNFSSTYTNAPWELTVREILNYSSFLYSISNRKKRISKIIEIFKINKLVDKKIKELSDGQKTKINLAKAFINFPKVLLLDEPTASLDPDIAHNLREFLQNQNKEFGMSMVFTSHNMAEIEQVCDRVIFLKNGKIFADDTPENLAKTITKARIQLFSKHLNLIESYAIKNQILYEIKGRFITLTIEEDQISHLLNSFAQQKLNYDEISILKPTLEDYFITMANTIK